MNNKKFYLTTISAIVFAIIIATVGSVITFAEDYIVDYGKCGENISWEINSAGKLTISGTGEMYNYNYSDSYTPHPWNSESVKIVEISEGVTSIGEYAFNGCNNMLTVSVPYGVTDIGDSAFFYCTSLESVVLPDSVNKIGKCAFFGCTSLSSVKLSNSIKIIEIQTFFSCSSLQLINIPKSCVSIEVWAFGYCSLKKISITANVNQISTDAFEYCPLEEITVDKDNMTFDSRDNCNAIIRTADNCLIMACDNTVIPIDVISIGDDAFRHCNNIKTIELPQNLISIGDRAFFYCESLGNIILPDSVKTIGTDVFSGCSSLKTAILPKEISEISLRMFQYCTSLESIIIPSEVKQVGDSAFYGCSSLKSVSLPDGLVSINMCAFDSCDSLESIYIPDNVSYIATSSFGSCKLLSEIVISDANKYYDSRNNCNAIIETRTNSLICGCNTTLIPDDIISINDFAFSGCSSLKEIIIPTSVQSIGTRAFVCCSSLQDVTISEGIKAIDNGAFCDCKSLEIIEIPDSVKSIGACAFSGCSSLKSVALPKELVEISGDLFSFCTSLEHVYIPSAVRKVGDYAFRDCSSLSKIELPNSVSSIGTYAFWHCSLLTQVTIPNGLTSIGYGAFSWCNSLKKIEIPDSVISIEQQAFDNCSSLESIKLSAGIKEISGALFYNCTSLKLIEIPNGVKTICNSAFCNCGSLQTVIIPNGVISIGGSSFGCCHALESIMLPDTVTCIGQSAFYGCSSLQTVKMPEKLKTIESQVFSDCNSLASIDIPNGVETIGSGVFSGTIIEHIYVPETLTNIDGYAFNGVKSISYSGPLSGAPWGAEELLGICEGEFIYLNEAKTTLIHCLTSTSGKVEVPEGVTRIENYAFASCKNITEIILPSTIRSMGYNVFYNTYLSSNETNWENDLLYYNDMLVASRKGNSTSYTIKNGTKLIADRVFENRYDILHIVIPSGVNIIGEKAFNNCRGLKSINVPDTIITVGEEAFGNILNVQYTGYNDVSTWGALYFNGVNDGIFTYSDNQKKNLIICSENASGSVIVPNSVETISAFAFYGCDKITELTVPFVGKSKTAEMREALFGYIFGYGDSNNDNTVVQKYLNCTVNSFIPSSINKVTITDADRISNGAFNGCDCIEELVLPFVGSSRNAAEKEGCFGYIYGTSDEQLEGYTEQKYSDTLSVYCQVPSSLKRVTITDDDTIPYGAFYGLSCIESITLSNNTRLIGNNSVYGTKLYNTVANWDHKMLCLNNGKFIVAYDEKKAQQFSGKIPSYTITISDNCFENASIRSLELNNKLKYIGNSAFENCTLLRSVIGAESVEVFGEKSFAGCTSLELFDISASTKTLPLSVFDSNLDKLVLNYGSSKADWKKLETYYDDVTVYYTLSSDDKRAVVIYCDDDVKYEAGNIEIEKVQVKTVSEKDSQVFNYIPESGFYEYRDANPYGIFDIKLINNNGDEIQPERGKTVTLKIKATDGFKTMLLEALNNFHGEFEDIVIFGGNIFYDSNSKVPDCTTDEVITDEFLRLIHFYTEKYEGKIYEAYDIKDITMEEGYFILNVPHFSEFSIVGNDKNVDTENKSLVVGDSCVLDVGTTEITKYTTSGDGVATVDSNGNVTAIGAGEVTVTAWNGIDSVKAFVITVNPSTCAILKYQKERTVEYKTSMRFHYEGFRPVNSKVCWYVNGEPYSEGEELYIDSPKDDYIIEARLITTSGTVCSEIERIKVKHGFFDKISWFFKNLFGSAVANIDQK